MADEELNPFKPTIANDPQFQSRDENNSLGGNLANFKDSTRRTKWTKRFLFAAIAITPVAIYSSVLEYNMLQDFQNGTYRSRQLAVAAAEVNDLRQGLIAIIQIIIAIVSGILWLMWIYRANYNAKQLGAVNMNYTPGWSVAWFFVPIANLWKPYGALKEIWQTSVNPQNWKAQTSTAILPVYWALHLVSNIGGQAVFRMSLNAETIPELLTLNVVYQSLDVVGMLLCFPIILFINRVYEMQMDHAYCSSPLIVDSDGE